MSHPHAGKQPVWFIPIDGDLSDGAVNVIRREGDKDVARVNVFATERRAWLEIADHVKTLIDSFEQGERDDFYTAEAPMQARIDENGRVIDDMGLDWGEADLEIEE